jgi:hypothetical protein
LQISEQGHFRSIGTHGFCQAGRVRPILTSSQLNRRNALSTGSSAGMIWAGNSPKTGGCRDGLHVDRVSGNQLAESTLAFLLSLAEMRLAQNRRTSFKEPIAVAEEYLRPVLVFLEQSNYVNTT